MHEQRHNPTRKSFKCNTCSKTFAYKGGLQKHIKVIHNPCEKIGCVFCKIEFKRQGDLNRHILRHIQEKSDQCEICHKEFYSFHKKVLHMRVHTGERPFSCKDCGESFTCITNLTRHKRKHLIVKPFRCVFCEKEFTARDLSWDHILGEISETWYECTICRKQIRTKVLLRAHQKTHGMGEFNCEKCGDLFKCKSYAKIHMERCHK